MQDLYQELIIDHGTEPRNFYPMTDYSCSAQGYNPLCGDKVTIFVKLDNNENITNISFQGSGCAISVASASMLTEVLVGKTISKAKAIFNDFQKLVTSEIADPNIATSLGKLSSLAGVRQYPSRIKCATLAWHALNKAIKQC